MIVVKSLLITLAATVLAVNADWHVSFTYADGGQIEAHGFVNSGCVDLTKTDSDIVTVYFEDNINSDTLELYGSKGCNDLKYTASAGSSNVPDRRYLVLN